MGIGDQVMQENKPLNIVLSIDAAKISNLFNPQSYVYAAQL